MSSRLWGLDRRQTILVFALVVVVGIVVGLLLGPTGGDDGPARRSTAGVPVIAAGTPGSPHAVWVFGFETLRFDPELALQGRLRARGAGDVVGRDGAVDLYDAASGRTARLVSARNRLTSLAPVAPGTAQTDVLVPVVAVAAGRRWLVSAPGTVTADGGGSTAVAPEVGAPVATGVVAGPTGVIAATAGADGIALARIDPATGKVVATGSVPVTAPFTLDGLTVDDTGVWVLAGGTAVAADPSSLTVTRRVPVAGQGPAPARGLVAAGGSLWSLADHGASLVRIDGGRSRVVLRILEAVPPSFRLPAGLVARGGRVYALVQRGSAAGDRRARLVGYDARRRRATPAVDLPSALFAGEIAAT